MKKNNNLRIGPNAVINLDIINKGFAIMERQNAFQWYEGLDITLTGIYEGLGQDHTYGPDTHVLISNVGINNEIIDHIWIRYAALANPYVFKMLRVGDPINLYGKVYSYENPDKKYSLEVKSISSYNVGTHFINMDFLYKTMICNAW